MSTFEEQFERAKQSAGDAKQTLTNLGHCYTTIDQENVAFTAQANQLISRGVQLSQPQIRTLTQPLAGVLREQFDSIREHCSSAGEFVSQMVDAWDKLRPMDKTEEQAMRYNALHNEIVLMRDASHVTADESGQMVNNIKSGEFWLDLHSLYPQIKQQATKAHQDLDGIRQTLVAILAEED